MTQRPQLPAGWLNAKQVLYGNMPDLIVGDDPERPQTTTHAGTPKISYIGPLAKWDTFHKSVWDFTHDQGILQHFDRCKHRPVYPSPDVEQLNPEASTREHVQVGAEITLSGRFYERILVPVTACVKTLTNPTVMEGRPATGILPIAATFGDSWIVEEQLRPDRDSSEKKQPDIVAKLRVNGENQARLVGELKFCAIVNLKQMVDNAIDPDPDLLGFSNILGQVYMYMVVYGTRFAFLSNYKWTIFLRIQDSTVSRRRNTEYHVVPCLYFSDPIHNSKISAEFQDRHGRSQSISVRSALFYLIHRTGLPNSDSDWRIPQMVRKNYLYHYASGNLKRYARMEPRYSQSALNPT